MKHGVTLTAIALGFFISSGAGIANKSKEVCDHNFKACNGVCIPDTDNCTASAIPFVAIPGSIYALPEKMVFQCKTGLQLTSKQNGFFVCEPAPPKPKEKSKK